VVGLTPKNKLVSSATAAGADGDPPEQTIYGAKRLVGRQMTSPAIEQVRARFKYPIVAGPKGEAAVKLGRPGLVAAGDLRAHPAEAKELALSSTWA
jgi:molecular chaperone DnaK